MHLRDPALPGDPRPGLPRQLGPHARLPALLPRARHGTARHVGCAKAFMQPAGTRAGDRRAGRVDARRLGDPRCRRSDRQVVRSLELKRPVWTVPVVVRSVNPAGPAPDAHAQQSGHSRHSARTVWIQRSAYAFALGACTGVTSISAPSERNTSSNARANFASRSRSTKRSCRPCSPSTRSRLRARWVTQPPSG
jgi:hypothetical protein